MQRVSNGLEVPKHTLDTFTGKTTFDMGPREGEIDCELTYVPKSINHIIVPPLLAVAGFICNALVTGLSGKVLTLKVYVHDYLKTTVMEDAAAACNGSGGAASHGKHTLNYIAYDCGIALVWAEPLDVIRVHYTVA